VGTGDILKMTIGKHLFGK